MGGRGRPFVKGMKRHPKAGRAKGTKNKWPATVKEAFMLAADGLGEADGLGGLDKLIQWARRHPTEFYKIIGKMLPREIEISGNPDAPLEAKVTFGGRYKPE